MITASPSEPRVAITGSMLVRTLPKNGAVGPNNIDTKTETATTNANNFVASHNQELIFCKRSILPPNPLKRKERGSLKVPLSHAISK